MATQGGEERTRGERGALVTERQRRADRQPDGGRTGHADAGGLSGLVIWECEGTWDSTAFVGKKPSEQKR